jgi:hypothetical protein
LRKKRSRRGGTSDAAAPGISQKPSKMIISKEEIYFRHYQFEIAQLNIIKFDK